MIRREFLKWCLRAVQAVSLLSFFASSARARDAWGGKQVSRHTKKPLKGIPSICQLCPARCGIIGFLEGDQLVKIGGNPKHPNNRGKLCSRGLAGVNLAYDPDRLASPMIRRGERGKGQWERISWERAYSEVAARLKSIYQDGKKGDLVFHSEREPQGMSRLFLESFGKALILSDDQLHFGNRDWGHWLTWGEERGVPDIANSHYVLNFGSNFYESHEDYTGFIGRMIEGRLEKKAKLVTFDVRLSYTAGNSDEWFPITPGTDGVIALAMANVILGNKLHAHNFIEKWLNVSPSQLARHLMKYTPEMAEKISGIAAADIERIAKEFALSMPAVAISGRGVTAHFNGVYNERCIFLLNALVGNIDLPGGYCLPRFYRLNGTPVTLRDSEKDSLSPQKFISLVKRGVLMPKIYFIWGANPAYHNPESGLTAEILKDEKRIPYLVVADSYMTETAMLADMVLPVSTYLESWGMEAPPSLDLVPFVALQQPIIRPQAKSVPIHDILIELGQRIGGALRRDFKFNSVEDYIKKAISNLPKLERAGGVRYLREHGVWFDEDEKPTYRIYASRGFNTPSGKIEIFSERLRKKGFDPLPAYEPIPGHGDLKGKFVLVTYEPNVMGATTANLKYLAEIKHRNFIWVNRDVAKALHIEEGDRVRIATRTGSVIMETRLTFGLHPRVVTTERNLGHWGYGHVAQAKAFQSKDPHTKLLWWEKEGSGVSPNQIILGESDPIGGGEAWNDTLVTISKV